MRKFISFFLAVSMMACLNACGGKQEAPAATPADTTAPSTKPTEAVQAETSAEEHKALVAYFSATHTTQGVAEKLAQGLNADLYEIVPVEPYTSADLDYNDNSSRTTLETNDPSARPAISGSVENMEQYDVIFLGYPIWWGDAPRIMSTFVESYDFSGKTVVPFCTSGGSGIGSSASNLEQLASSGTWLEGRRFSGRDSPETILNWANGLGIWG